MKPSRRRQPPRTFSDNSHPARPAAVPPVRGPQERRIDVRVDVLDDGRRRVVLQDLSYGPGIGWYAQKTIHLDPQQVDALMGALCCMKQVVEKRDGEPPAAPAPEPGAKIVRLEDIIRRK